MAHFHRIAMWRSFPGLLLLSSVGLNQPTPAYGDFSEEQRVHHFYNAELLDKHEFQISIASNIKFGLFEDLEIGGNGLALLGGLPNLSLKHRMFSRDSFKTAFSSHMFILSGSASAESDAEEGESDTSDAGTSTAFFGAIGVLTSHDLGRGNTFSWGVYDFLTFGQLPLVDIDISAHFISPTISYDKIIGRRFALTAAVAYPVYMHGKLKNVAVEAELNTSAIGNDYGKGRMQAFATGTFSIGVFNIEFGLARIFATTTPYFNLFWRF